MIGSKWLYRHYGYGVPPKFLPVNNESKKRSARASKRGAKKIIDRAEKESWNSQSPGN
jgi:hypothetical protein